MQIYKAFVVHIAHPLVKIKMLDATCVERRRATQQAVNLIAFLKQKLCKERTILTRDTSYKCFLHWLNRPVCIVHFYFQFNFLLLLPLLLLNLYLFCPVRSRYCCY